MMSAYGVTNAADELIDALLEMSGLLAAKTLVRDETETSTRFVGLGIGKPPSLNELDERLSLTFNRVNTAVASYRSVR